MQHLLLDNLYLITSITWSLTYSIVIPVREHNKQGHGVAFSGALGYEQVVRPAAAAEVKFRHTLVPGGASPVQLVTE